MTEGSPGGQPNTSPVPLDQCGASWASLPMCALTSMAPVLPPARHFRFPVYLSGQPEHPGGRRTGGKRAGVPGIYYEYIPYLPVKGRSSTGCFNQLTKNNL